jgi:hypothetical protein
MELAHAWPGLLRQILQMLATNWGLGARLAIVMLTLAMRAALLPITWPIALRAAAKAQFRPRTRDTSCIRLLTPSLV